jgi:(p)ppGpp synthase/HD superfamily hydrolase
MKESPDNIVEIAKKYAIECHESTNHYYDGDKPYSVHLKMVVGIAWKFSPLILIGDLPVVVAGCWVHDCIEDCRQTYNDVKEATNEPVAELAYAMTNEKGKNRAQRGSEKYYEDMKAVPYAVFIKICDRIANTKYSRDTGSRMLTMYAKESDKFKARLFDSRYSEMFDYLEELLSQPE